MYFDKARSMPVASFSLIDRADSLPRRRKFGASALLEGEFASARFVGFARRDGSGSGALSVLAPVFSSIIE
jgi:hypothetical protein